MATLRRGNDMTKTYELQSIASEKQCSQQKKKKQSRRRITISIFNSRGKGRGVDDVPAVVAVLLANVVGRLAVSGRRRSDDDVRERRDVEVVDDIGGGDERGASGDGDLERVQVVGAQPLIDVAAGDDVAAAGTLLLNEVVGGGMLSLLLHAASK
ncbi:hypothetical protein E2562_024709 [Oryza meyeriana var. granulata]|uniref:Uncharacterized protein n=1 Tax=Oryza meyeriana var. granulata TaxID=110450 RepID=A0A6G1D655_9ORYZ|nr:hypothetical protein E2562_024709 [Oryza meyeriana var. granulata]